MASLNLLWFLPVCWAYGRVLMAIASSTLDEVIQ